MRLARVYHGALCLFTDLNTPCWLFMIPGDMATDPYQNQVAVHSGLPP